MQKLENPLVGSVFCTIIIGKSIRAWSCVRYYSECTPRESWLYRIAQNFCRKKISPNALALYSHKNFAAFIFAHSERCSPGSSGWSHQMNTPCSADADWYLTHGPRFWVLACCMLFTAALASAMTEGDSSDDRDLAGLGKARGTTLKVSAWQNFHMGGKIIRRKGFRPRCTWVKKVKFFSGQKFCAIWYVLIHKWQFV